MFSILPLDLGKPITVLQLPKDLTFPMHERIGCLVLVLLDDLDAGCLGVEDFVDLPESTLADLVDDLVSLGEGVSGGLRAVAVVAAGFLHRDAIFYNNNDDDPALTYNHGSILIVIILPAHDLLRHHTLMVLLNQTILLLLLLPPHRPIHNDHRRIIDPHLIILIIIGHRDEPYISSLLLLIHDLIVFHHHVDEDIL